MAQKHSGLGIASFIISIVTGVLMFLLIAIAGIMESSTPGGIDENSAEAALIGFLAIGFLLLDLVAIGLGIGGLVQENRKKVFAILGVSFSGSTIFFTLAIMLLGLAA